MKGPWIKAFFMLVVLMFHSFVLTPKVQAASMGVVVDIAVARQAFRSVAPSVLKATPAGRGYVLAYMGVAAVGYILMKSGAVTALKNWLNGQLVDSSLPQTVGWSPERMTGNGTPYKVYCYGIGGGVPYYYIYYGAGYSMVFPTGGGGTNAAGVNGWIAERGGQQGSPAPTTPTDYGVPLTTSQPSYPNDSVFFSPGAKDILNGENQVISATEMSDADIDKMKNAMSATGVDTAGNQARPSANDNTLSTDANATIPILQQIMNYVSNLVGIKTDTGKISSNTDNLVSGQSAQVNATNLMKSAMDNVAIAVNNQTAIDNQILAKQDNIAQTTSSLKDALTETTANVNSLQTRINNLKTLMSTKFPFSFIQGITVPTDSGEGTSLIPDIVLPTGQHWVVDPMQYSVIKDFFGVVKTLLSVAMWAIFTLVMVRRVTQI